MTADIYTDLVGISVAVEGSAAVLLNFYFRDFAGALLFEPAL